MKSFKLAIILTIITFFAITPLYSSDLSTFVEGSLRKPLNMISGPATQVVDFQLNGITYVIVISDLSFNKTITPFNNKQKENERTSKEEIVRAVRNTFVKIQNTRFKTRKVIYIIIFDKKLFGRTNNKTLRKFMFKGEYHRGKLVNIKEVH